MKVIDFMQMCEGEKVFITEYAEILFDGTASRSLPGYLENVEIERIAPNIYGNTPAIQIVIAE